MKQSKKLTSISIETKNFRWQSRSDIQMTIFYMHRDLLKTKICSLRQNCDNRKNRSIL